MLNRKITSRLAKAVTAVAAVGVGAAAILAGAPNVGADPLWPSSLVGHGSDTTQDVVGALAGDPQGPSGTFYTPVSVVTGAGVRTILNSWNATGSACVTPRAPGASIQRGNGSSDGRRILSRAIDGGLWGPTAGTGCQNKPTALLVDFARSSSGPGSITGTDLIYIPFARDAVSFGYAVSSGTAPVTSLTQAQLTQIMGTGGITVGSTNIIGCGLQTSSGTYSFWNTANGITAAQENTATSACNALGTGARMQENDGNALAAKAAAAPANTQVISGFSAANYIAQNNGVVTSQLPACTGTVPSATRSVLLGTITGVGTPYAGSPCNPPALTPDSTFYGSTTFGRNVFNVVDAALVNNPGAAALKAMFVSFPGPSPAPTTAAICNAGSTINAFGFLTIANCGSIATTGGLVP